MEAARYGPLIYSLYCPVISLELLPVPFAWILCWSANDDTIKSTCVIRVHSEESIVSAAVLSATNICVELSKTSSVAATLSMKIRPACLESEKLLGRAKCGRFFNDKQGILKIFNYILCI